MRFSSYLWVVVLISLITGCTKNADKDIENPGISFLYGANSRNDFILRPSSSPQKVTNLLLVNLRSANPTSSDIHVTIADNTALLLNAYNSAHNTSIEPLPKTIWSMPSELVIQKDKQYTLGEITVSNTSSLDLSKQYAIGISITGVSNGNKLADNLSNLFIVFRIQNILDGRYNMRGEHYYPPIAPTFVPHNYNVELHTTGPNSVRVFWTAYGGYNIPIPGYPGVYNSQELSFFLNPATNTISCSNTFVASSLLFESINTYNGNTYNNRWNPTTQTVYAAWGYLLGSGGTIVFGSSRAWIDTLTYLGPR